MAAEASDGKCAKQLTGPTAPRPSPPPSRSTTPFLELTPHEHVVEIDEFETTNPNLQGEMRITISHRPGGNPS
jgi:hypothetical protein